ncbi:alpha/beta fold hydrolase [Oceanobacillus piezotolerans]|uniref:Alpha/beta fold hydrolase n=1 Tax=Oceanobacillus piezotolerans TaxID=2448030 RepID=A0A498D5Y4_9BACI|nr:alpha/beta fold hydrolase [Oceanobacillus piezotolerans]RLL44866.1 alpha/beta fold hydrolase [Oceanobacillus piezotolerans]
MKEKYPVIPGAESFYIRKNKIGILISHGFMGTPQSVRYIGEAFASLGYTVHAPRLKGHGTHYKDLEKCTKDDWYQSLEDGYKALQKECTTVFVLGQSMGGTLALQLAHQYPNIAGLILINTALSLPAYDPLREQMEPRYIDESAPDIKAKNVSEITYSRTPLHAIHELQTLMSDTPKILREIQCPTLGIRSKDDHVVPPMNTNYILNQISSKSKKLLILHDSYHVASMDNDKDYIVEACHQFLEQQLESKAVYN